MTANLGIVESLSVANVLCYIALNIVCLAVVVIVFRRSWRRRV